MKLRPLFLIILLLGGFYIITTQMAPTGVLAGWVQQNVLNNLPGHTRVPATTTTAALPGLHMPLELTEASAQTAYDSDEVNNISV
jgi:hypothetical protein